MQDNSAVAAIIGYPVSHSLSPRLHNFWLAQNKLYGEYVRMPVAPEELGDVIKRLPTLGLKGANLTIPHKETVMPLIDEIDKEATVIGAVNTIIVKDGKLIGTNTDAYGFFANIEPHLSKQRNKAVVLGAGGAAKAVCHSLLGAGFKELIITNRTRERAEELAEWFGSKVHVANWQDREKILDGADLLVNSTSLGMNGKEPLNLRLDALPKDALVTDIVYTPLQTKLLADAEARGNHVVDGLGMLLHQAVPAFEAWFGVRPQVTMELRNHVLAG